MSSGSLLHPTAMRRRCVGCATGASQNARGMLSWLTKTWINSVTYFAKEMKPGEYDRACFKLFHFSCAQPAEWEVLLKHGSQTSMLFKTETGTQYKTWAIGVLSGAPSQAMCKIRCADTIWHVLWKVVKPCQATSSRVKPCHTWLQHFSTLQSDWHNRHNTFLVNVGGRQWMSVTYGDLWWSCDKKLTKWALNCRWQNHAILRPFCVQLVHCQNLCCALLCAHLSPTAWFPS